MSLDVYLTTKETIIKDSSGIFIREYGSTKEITVEEWNKKYPERAIGLISKEDETEELFWANITHNLGDMAAAAGIYEALWRPNEINAIEAKDIIEIVEKGLTDMKARPEYYKKFNAPNGWGTYKNFVPWVEKYLDACKKYPDAIITVSR